MAPSPRVDIAALGPQVGTPVPAFSLPDQRGELRTLASIAGPKGTMLVLSRSADW
jgi:peroxiredoxin